MDAKFRSSLQNVEQLNSPSDSNGTREKNQINCNFFIASLQFVIFIILFKCSVHWCSKELSLVIVWLSQMLVTDFP